MSGRWLLAGVLFLVWAGGARTAPEELTEQERAKLQALAVVAQMLLCSSQRVADNVKVGACNEGVAT